MKVTEVRILPSLGDGKLKAFANITFDDAFVVRGLKVIDGQNGLFISMPSRTRPDGSHQDVAHPINNEMRENIEEAVFQTYQHYIENEVEEESEEEIDEEE